MGRPGLMQHRKTRRAIRDIGSAALLRGSLELIWDTCYEAGDDYLGSSEDVELAAQWAGSSGVLTQALARAGGEGNVGFIEPDPERPGWRIHDLFENAPEYVQKRLLREIARKERGETISSLRSAAGRKGRALQLAKQTAGKHSANDGLSSASDKQTADACPDIQSGAGQTAANGGTPVPAPAPSTSSLRSEESPKLLTEDTTGSEDQVLALWGEIAVPGGLPAVLDLGSGRKTHLKARLKEKNWIGLFKEAITYAAQHPDAAWMRGGGNRPWKADLDYFLKPGKVVQTVEKARVATARPRASPLTGAPNRRCATADAEHRDQLAHMAPFPTLPPVSGEIR